MEFSLDLAIDGNCSFQYYPPVCNPLFSNIVYGLSEKITILLTQTKDDFGGYFNTGDEYPKVQVPTSNEREMLYFNVDYITNPLA